MIASAVRVIASNSAEKAETKREPAREAEQRHS